MSEGGLGSMNALAAATSGSASAIGLPDLGRLRQGAVADLVVVDGDPVADVRLLVRPSRIRLVIHDGLVVAGRDLDGPAIGRAAAVDEGSLEPPGGPPSPCCGLGDAS
jgi:imidazolonepropionase-like amidohydrolase